MKSNKIYCIDSNIFIWIHRYYPRTVFPDLWDKLEDLFSKGKIVSHLTVFNEICHDKKKKDILAEWISNYENKFIDTSQRQLELIPEIIRLFPKLIDPNRESEQADPWLIATILELKESDKKVEYTLVSGENRNSTVKLPAACRHYNIDEINLIEFFQDNRWTFRIN